MSIYERKDDHIRICLEEDVRSGHNYWDDVHLKHKALPKTDLEEVGLETDFLGYRLKYPMIITAITGGVDNGKKINEVIAAACEKYQIGMGLGSQRIALEDPSVEDTFSVVKDRDIPLVIANLGLPQFSNGFPGTYGSKEVEKAMEMIGADMLAVHFNLAQEALQTNGDPLVKGAEENLQRLTMDYPMMAKEVGNGIDMVTGKKLANMGFKAMDVSGVSGTSFPAVEMKRHGNLHGKEDAEWMEPFVEWGHPAPASLYLNRKSSIPLIASGGIRNGVDGTKALALGATLFGMAGVILPYADKGPEALEAFISNTIKQLKTAIFLSGGTSSRDPTHSPPIIVPPLRWWLP